MRLIGIFLAVRCIGFIFVWLSGSCCLGSVSMCRMGSFMGSCSCSCEVERSSRFSCLISGPILT